LVTAALLFNTFVAAPREALRGVAVPCGWVAVLLVLVSRKDLKRTHRRESSYLENP
jgi:hypothetical protein